MPWKKEIFHLILRKVGRIYHGGYPSLIIHQKKHNLLRLRQLTETSTAGSKCHQATQPTSGRTNIQFPQLERFIPKPFRNFPVTMEAALWLFILLPKTQMLSGGDGAHLATWEDMKLAPAPNLQIIFFIQFYLKPVTLSCKIHKWICSCCIILDSLFMGGLCLSSHR